MSKEIVNETNIKSIVFIGVDRRNGCSTIKEAFEKQLRLRLASNIEIDVDESLTSCEFVPSSKFNDGSSDILLPYYLEMMEKSNKTLLVLIRGKNSIMLNNPPSTERLITVFRCDAPENAHDIAFNCNSICIPSTEKVEDIDVTLLVDRCVTILKNNSIGHADE